MPALCPIFPRAGQPEPGGRRRGDITSRGIQFRQLCGDIRIDSLGGDEQLRGDLGVGVNSRRRSGRLHAAPRTTLRSNAAPQAATARDSPKDRSRRVTNCRTAAIQMGSRLRCPQELRAAAERPRPIIRQFLPCQPGRTHLFASRGSIWRSQLTWTPGTGKSGPVVT